MGRMLDTLENSWTKGEEDLFLFTNEDYVLSMFNEHRIEIDPFNECLKHVYENKKQQKVAKTTASFLLCLELKKKVFAPSHPSNLETDHAMHDLSMIVATTILDEIRHPNKATHHYSSSSNGICS